MSDVTYSLGLSLDGYVTDADGTLDWASPSDEIFRFCIDEIRGVGVHLMGRRLYEAMRYWEDPPEGVEFDDAQLEWTELWNPLPKVVFSTSLTEVHGAARLANDDLATEIGRLKAESDDGDIAIGGATLAHQAVQLGLVDEYRMRVHPVVLGGGLRYLPDTVSPHNLDLVETRTFDNGVVFLRYRTVR